ncbi:hypothetical protein ABK040_013809 [Willaertia magna]
MHNSMDRSNFIRNSRCSYNDGVIRRSCTSLGSNKVQTNEIKLPAIIVNKEEDETRNYKEVEVKEASLSHCDSRKLLVKSRSTENFQVIAKQIIPSVRKDILKPLPDSRQNGKQQRTIKTQAPILQKFRSMLNVGEIKKLTTEKEKLKTPLRKSRTSSSISTKPATTTETIKPLEYRDIKESLTKLKEQMRLASKTREQMDVLKGYIALEKFRFGSCNDEYKQYTQPDQQFDKELYKRMKERKNSGINCDLIQLHQHYYLSKKHLKGDLDEDVMHIIRKHNEKTLRKTKSDTALL